jgi:hypothetical protein
MCINCNLLCPISHGVCDILGIEKNKYGLASHALDTFNFLLIDILNHYRLHNLDSQFVLKEYATPNERHLYRYLLENGLLSKILELVQQDEYTNLVNRQVINFATYQYFDVHTLENLPDNYDIMNKLAIPAHLLSTNVDSLKKCLRPVKYTQVVPIPEDFYIKYNINKSSFYEQAEKYDIIMLDNPSKRLKT